MKGHILGSVVEHNLSVDFLTQIIRDYIMNLLGFSPQEQISGYEYEYIVMNYIRTGRMIVCKPGWEQEIDIVVKKGDNL